jgi:hypothetical protein
VRTGPDSTTRPRTPAVLLALFLVACSDGGEDPPCCQSVPGGLYATFDVGSEVIHVSFTHPDGMAQVRAVWAGTSSATIPNGELVCGAVPWNPPWHWHMNPESVRMADVTAEVCDGEPSYVEANCATFGAGRYCPWAAAITDLRDCSVDPTCPQVPR